MTVKHLVTVSVFTYMYFIVVIILCAVYMISNVSYVELFHTEQTHVRELRVMDLLFYQRMMNETWLSRDLINLLFPSLDKVIKIHGWCSACFLF